jgi:hypothetical protein
MPWDLDSSVTKSAFHALDALVRKGKLEIDNWSTVREKMLEQYKAGDDKAVTGKSDAPWATNIRRGPKG